VKLQQQHALRRNPEILAGRGDDLEAGGQQVVGVADVVEGRVAGGAGRMDTRLLRLAGELGGLGQIAVSQRDDGGQRQALGSGGFAEKFRHPAVAEQLSPCQFAAQQLAELRNDDCGRRIEVGAGVEDDIGALDVAGEGQELGQEDSGADIGRRPAHRGIGRRQCVGKIAFAEQTTGLARVGCSSG
jgi:hypothetical protein